MELIVTMVVMGVLAVTVVVLVPSRAPFHAEGLSRVFLQDLRLTKIMSMSENERYRFVTQSGSYEIRNQAGTRVKQTPYPAGTTVTPQDTLIFDALGRPYDSEGNPLTTTKTYSISVEGSTKSIRVIPVTGLIQ